MYKMYFKVTNTLNNTNDHKYLIIDSNRLAMERKTKIYHPLETGSKWNKKSLKAPKG